MVSVVGYCSSCVVVSWVLFGCLLVRFHGVLGVFFCWWCVLFALSAVLFLFVSLCVCVCVLLRGVSDMRTPCCWAHVRCSRVPNREGVQSVVEVVCCVVCVVLFVSVCCQWHDAY